MFRFGEDVAQYAVDPLVRGICAGNARELSVHFIASYLHQKEQADGSAIKVRNHDIKWEGGGAELVLHGLHYYY